MLFTQEELEILDKIAPDGATHVGHHAGQNFYFKVSNGLIRVFASIGEWSKVFPLSSLNSDIRFLQKLPNKVEHHKCYDYNCDWLEVGDRVKPAVFMGDVVKYDGTSYEIVSIARHGNSILLHNVGDSEGYAIKFNPNNFIKVKHTPIEFTQEEYDELHDELSLKDELIGELQQELEDLKNREFHLSFRVFDEVDVKIDCTVNQLLTGDVKWSF